MEYIARIHSDFPTKFGIPRQSGLTDALISKIVFEPKFRNPDCLRGIEQWSHLSRRRSSGERRAWACLQRALRSARTRSGCRA